MSKPRGVKWLEEQPGERLDRTDDCSAHVNNPNREAIDTAIAVLERLRRSIDPSAA